MLNGDGKLIGVNTAIFSPVNGSIGIGFAIPANAVKKILPELIERATSGGPGSASPGRR